MTAFLQVVYTADYATYVQILTWIIDSPLTLCPSSVHGMALAGKELGKQVRQWGSSTAVGAIECVDVAIVAECMLKFLSGRWCKASRLNRPASWSPSTARSSRRRILRIISTHPNVLVLASYRGGEGVRSLYSSVFGLEETVSTRSIT